MIGVAHQLELYVYDRTGRSIPDAIITAQPRDSVDIYKASYDSARELYYIDIAHVQFVTIIVSHAHYESEKRIVRIDSGHTMQVFILIEEGQPFLYTGQGKVPYSAEDALVFLLEHDEEPDAAEPEALIARPGRKSEVEERKHAIASNLKRALATDLALSESNIEILKTPGKSPYMQAGIMRSAQGSQKINRRNRNSLLKDLRKNPRVKGAGPLFRRGALSQGGEETSLQYITNRIAIEFFPEISREDIEKFLQSRGLELVRAYGIISIYEVAADVSVAEDINAIVESLQKSELVVGANVIIEGIAEFDVTPGDFLWPALWDRQLVGLNGLNGAWRFLEVNLPGTTRRYGDASTVIGLTDSGVRSSLAGVPQNVDFQGTVTSSIVVQLTSQSGGDDVLRVNSTNGFAVGQIISIGALGTEEVVIREIRTGELHLTTTPSVHAPGTNVHVGGMKLYRYYDFNRLAADNSAPSIDHGMWCAGVATAQADNAGTGVVGVAPNARLLSVQVREPFSDADNTDALLWCAGLNPRSVRAIALQLHRGADVISCSAGFGAGAALSGFAAGVLEMISRRGRYGRGCPSFFSAGNNGVDIVMARPYGVHDRTFSCAASTLNATEDERRATYSNHGLVEWCAPSSTGALPHNPPNSFSTFTAATTGTGDLPASAATSVALTGAGVAIGGTIIDVNPAPAANFAINDWIIIGNPGPRGGWEFVQITGANSATQFVITATRGGYPATTPVYGGPNDFTTQFGGTSAATPLAAGIATLVLTAKPSLTWAEVGEIMRTTAVRIDTGATNAAGRWMDAPIGMTGLPILDPLNLLALWPFRSGTSTKISIEAGTATSAVVAPLPVLNTAGLAAGDYIMIGRGTQTPEVKRITAATDAVTLQMERLDNGHNYYDRVERVVRTRLNIGSPNTVIGATSIVVLSSAGFSQGDAVAIGYNTPASEIVRVTAITNATTIAVTALTVVHPDNSTVDRVGTSLTAPNPTVGPLIDIDVHSTTGFEPGQAILLGNLGGAGSQMSSVVSIINANTLRICRVSTAHPINTVVIGGGTAMHSRWYGSGRVDAEAAVRTAFNYNHDHRDLMIRKHRNDDGVAVTDTSVNRILSPDIWVRNTTPNVDGENALPLNYPLPVSYDLDAPHEIPATIGDRWIYARIRNRGNALDGLYANARFYLWRTNTNDPFVIPMDWQDQLPPAGLAANVIHPAIPGLAAGGNGPFFIEERSLFNAARHDNLPRLVGGISPDGHFIVKTVWSNANLPPQNAALAARLRTHILVEITPQDGVLADRDIRKNNNVATREITFAQTLFRRNSTDPLQRTIEVGRSGTNVTQAFEVQLNDTIGFFRTEEITVEITRARNDGTYEVATFAHNGTAWAVATPQTGISINAPVVIVGGVDSPASGDQFNVTFRGSFTVNNAADRLGIRVILKSHNQVVLSDITHSILVTEVPVHYSGDDIVSSSKPRFNAFAEMSKLTQTAALAFGPKTANQFRLTSGFTAAANTKVFAAVTGVVFVQKIWNPTAGTGGTGAYETDVVNLILKPLRQSQVDFTSVKYFIYRGLKLSDFFTEITPGDLRVQNAPGTSQFLDSFFVQHQAHVTAAAAQGITVANPPKSDALGWDNAVTAPQNEFLDKFFYSSDASFQYPVVTRGMSLGTFHETRDVGFEIVLEEGDFRPKMGFAQAPFYEKVVAMGATTAIQYEREEILNFVDPAAYYGMHYDTGVEDAGTTKKEGTLYTDVISRFNTANTVYVDIRNENGYSMDYYGNYSSSTLKPMKMGPDLSVSSMPERTYDYMGWPIVAYSGSIVTTNTFNPLFLALRVADNKSPVIYVERGEIHTRSKGRFITDADLKGRDTTWTKEFGFKLQNTSNPSVAGSKVYVANVIKLHYSRRHDATTIWPTKVVKTEKYLDNVFGPLNATMFWQPGGTTAVTKWISAQDKKFIDASAVGSNPFFAYMAERGIASEPPEAAGGTARVVFFASAISYLKDNPERVKNVRGIIGGYSSRGDLVESSRLFDGLDMGVTVIHDTPPGAGSPIEVKVPRLVSEVGSDVKPKDVLLLGIAQAQYDALAAQGLADLSPYHQMNVFLTDETPGTDPSTGAYKRYRLGVQGKHKTTEVNHIAFPSPNIYVYTVDGCFFASSTFGTLQELAHYQPTPEELLADERTEPDSIIGLDTPMVTLVNAFGPAVSAASIPNNPAAAGALETALKLAAGNILAQARTYAKSNYDDRQLYWSRLQMTIRYQEHDYLQTNEPTRKLLRRYFEEYSRGVEGPNGVSFSGVGGKKVLVIGFDPYMLSSGIDRKSPGGVAALALHGEAIAGTGKIQSIILPVRYRDFKDGWVDTDGSGAADTRGLIEEIIPKYLSGANAVHAIVVLGDSTGRRGFEAERFAARARGGVADNNNDRELGPVGDGTGWNEFYEDVEDTVNLIGTIPTPIANQIYFYDQSYQSDSGSRAHPLDDSSVNLNTVISGNPTGISKIGSGGHYLFNEAFYRIAHLKAATTGSTTRVRLISMPAPEAMVPPTTMQDVVTKVKVLIDRA